MVDLVDLVDLRNLVDLVAGVLKGCKEDVSCAPAVAKQPITTQIN